MPKDKDVAWRAIEAEPTEPKPIELYVVVDQDREVQGHADSIGAAYKIACEQLVHYTDYDHKVLGAIEGETRRIVRMVEAS